MGLGLPVIGSVRMEVGRLILVFQLDLGEEGGWMGMG